MIARIFPPVKPHPPLPLHLRCTAAMAACLVLVLGLVGASPTLHAWLHAPAAAAGAAHDHGHGHPSQDDGHHHGGSPAAPADHDDAGCVVYECAHGVTLAVALLAEPAPPHARPVASQAHVQPELLPPAPRYLRQPERGPPAS